MTMTPKKCVDHRGQWPEPHHFEYTKEMDDSTAKKIRDTAKAPAVDDPDWTTVDGPGW